MNCFTHGEPISQEQEEHDPEILCANSIHRDIVQRTRTTLLKETTTSLAFLLFRPQSPNEDMNDYLQRKKGYLHGIEDAMHTIAKLETLKEPKD